MKIYIKFYAIALGALFSLLGISSCSSDDDNNTNECCTYSYTDEGVTYTYTYCADGSYTYAIDGVVIDDTPWSNDSSWDEIKSELLSEGATCN